MDGTLLTNTNEISQRNKEAIHMIINQGVKVFLATGRQYDITVPYYEQLKLKTPMICLNGAALYDGYTGKLIQKKPVKINHDLFHRKTAEEACNVIIHTEAGMYCKERSEEVIQWTLEGRVPPQYIGDLRQASYGDVLKYSVNTGKVSLSLAMPFTKDADVIHWDNGFELIARGVSKWSAIHTLICAYGIRREEVVTIGDGPNDISMLRHAGLGVAMGNATKNVKANADMIIGHHDEDSLAVFIEDYLINSYSMNLGKTDMR
ncbi:Cof subfamily protein (haloacid dehalogenase superfamily) [Evansella vedderi]|uniref:Cof subfamily protein (Haloacid dehalogenase superfamily) n=2 Tax=Evansella vedderi TaxID=38282 RepID=A0ABT9ZYR4_9BACI|nr:HAD family hydrolase [Evansella vedderi]MDQ0256382.1 Cof subfamily protein (haloacid dehalogenase superfamily) [Evansella vedderi]